MPLSNHTKSHHIHIKQPFCLISSSIWSFHPVYLSIYPSISIRRQKTTNSTSLCRRNIHIFKMCSVHILMQLDAVWKSHPSQFWHILQWELKLMDCICTTSVFLLARWCQAKQNGLQGMTDPFLTRPFLLISDFFGLLQTLKFLFIDVLNACDSQSN